MFKIDLSMVCKNFDYVFSVLYSSLRNKLGKNLEKNILYVWICFLCFIVRYFFYMCLFENRSDKNIWFYLLCFAGQIFYWSLSHTSCHNWWEIWHLSGEQWVNSWKDLNMILVLEQVWSNKILYILCSIISQEPEPKSKIWLCSDEGQSSKCQTYKLATMSYSGG